MKRVKIAELKDNLSRHLRAVERGREVVEVTDRDRPIARIVPIPRREEQLTIIPPKRPWSEVREMQVPPATGTFDIVELLLEDRRKR